MKHQSRYLPTWVTLLEKNFVAKAHIFSYFIETTVILYKPKSIYTDVCFVLFKNNLDNNIDLSKAIVYCALD